MQECKVMYIFDAPNRFANDVDGEFMTSAIINVELAKGWKLLSVVDTGAVGSVKFSGKRLYGRGLTVFLVREKV